jgi:hypothetical protein
VPCAYIPVVSSLASEGSIAPEPSIPTYPPSSTADTRPHNPRLLIHLSVL